MREGTRTYHVIHVDTTAPIIIIRCGMSGTIVDESVLHNVREGTRTNDNVHVGSTAPIISGYSVSGTVADESISHNVREGTSTYHNRISFSRARDRTHHGSRLFQHHNRYLSLSLAESTVATTHLHRSLAASHHQIGLSRPSSLASFAVYLSPWIVLDELWLEVHLHTVLALQATLVGAQLFVGHGLAVWSRVGDFGRLRRGWCSVCIGDC